MNSYFIYTDGSLKGNPKGNKPLRGGYSAIICTPENKILEELFGGKLNTTSPRMEISGVLAGLKAIEKPSKITIISDSQYVVNTVRDGWLYQILEYPNSFSNVDLWTEVAQLLEYHDVTFVWTKGHADNELNNRADELAQFAAKLLNLPEDEYINNSKENRKPLVSESETRRPDGIDSGQKNGEVLYSLG